MYYFSIQPELDPKRYGLSEDDTVTFKGILNIGKPNGTIKEAIQFLSEVYSKNMSAEFLHLEVNTAIYKNK